MFSCWNGSKVLRYRYLITHPNFTHMRHLKSCVCTLVLRRMAGFFLMGITDNGRVTGFTYNEAHELMQATQSAIGNWLAPNHHIKLRVEVNDRFIVLAEIPPTLRASSWRGSRYSHGGMVVSTSSFHFLQTSPPASEGKAFAGGSWHCGIMIDWTRMSCCSSKTMATSLLSWIGESKGIWRKLL